MKIEFYSALVVISIVGLTFAIRHACESLKNKIAALRQEIYSVQKQQIEIFHDALKVFHENEVLERILKRKKIWTAEQLSP
jgi:hypothetical protein